MSRREGPWHLMRPDKGDRQLDLDFPEKVPPGKYAPKLFLLDISYFGPRRNEEADDPELHANQIEAEEKLCYALATWCWDNDFGVNYESWQMLEAIRKLFGNRVRKAVLYNMFHRNHDT